MGDCMASRTITMYSEKRYELEELKEGIKSEFYKMHFDAEIVGEVARELGETKTLVLLFERYYLRTESHASLIVLLSEFRGYQSADIIATGGKELLFSFGAEENFAKWGEEALRNLGFLVKVR